MTVEITFSIIIGILSFIVFYILLRAIAAVSDEREYYKRLERNRRLERINNKYKRM